MQSNSIRSPLSAETFEQLLKLDESTLIDFKREMYDLDNDDSEFTKAGKFAKDVISFINTIRTESAYIIIGVDVKPDKSKDLLGLDKDYDSAILISKIKDKIYPAPIFSYYTILYQNKKFGIFEFPVYKYPNFLTSTIKMKKVVAGQPYYRLGSTNTEAVGITCIHIHEWMKGLPGNPNFNSTETILNDVTYILKKAVNPSLKLSEIIVEASVMSTKHNFAKLKEFCLHELKGVPSDLEGKRVEVSDFIFNYRFHKVGFSDIKYSSIFPHATKQLIKADIEKNRGIYYEVPLIFNNSITEIENIIEEYKKNILRTSDSNLKSILPDWENDRPITFYYFAEDYKAVYSKIRQQLINLLSSVSEQN